MPLDERFWEMGDLNSLNISPHKPTENAYLIRQLGEFKPWSGKKNLIQYLEEAYLQVGQAALKQAMADE